ncbi:class I fructose-bisphosphate aldolase family protein [Heliorestis acidaminivorans]|uniref:Class I fructose-bisphosphate aldolase family protein n=2 Tax=Heliorestis acidaminivorans TaxID=553427 RepID=A0A6I0EWW0_9FIRM|nr:class I fructose-bisphosphate aldolase family protein [Heliorestis acidaminivorans]
MTTGKQIRLQRLFKDARRLLIVPMDHGVTLGPVAGLIDIRTTTLQCFQGGADAVIVHKGLTKQLATVVGVGYGEMILHLSASTSLGVSSHRKEQVATVEEALRYGATAVSVHVNLGAPSEGAMLREMGQVAEQCERWGMPLLAMMYVRDGNPTSEFDPKKIKHAARVAEELGADLVKLNYSGSAQSFHEVTSSVQIPVLIAGGERMDSDEALYQTIDGAVKGGARGVAIGRNIFQHPQPAHLCQAIRLILDSDI